MFLVYVSYGWECAIDCNKFCFLAPDSYFSRYPDSYFSRYKDKKNIGTQIFFSPKTSIN